jgi:hypothetical protein
VSAMTYTHYLDRNLKTIMYKHPHFRQLLNYVPDVYGNVFELILALDNADPDDSAPFAVDVQTIEDAVKRITGEEPVFIQAAEGYQCSARFAAAKLKLLTSVMYAASVRIRSLGIGRKGDTEKTRKQRVTAPGEPARAAQYMQYIIESSDLCDGKWEARELDAVFERYTTYVSDAVLTSDPDSDLEERVFFFPHLDTIEFLFRVTTHRQDAPNGALYGLDWSLHAEPQEWAHGCYEHATRIVARRIELEQRLMLRRQNRALPQRASEPTPSV